MRLTTRFSIYICVLAICLFVVPAASADDWNKKTTVTFSAAVEVPGVGAQVLPAGTYVFKLLDSASNRHIVQIFNADETQVMTTILAIPNYRLRATDKTVMTFRERAAGEPEAIRAWFYPGRQWGEEFVYPRAKALELAKVSNEPVLYAPIEFTSVEELKTAPVEAVKPTGEVVRLEEVVEAPPVEVAEAAVVKVAEAPPAEVAAAPQPETLPATASYLPLLGVIGFLSVAAAGLLRKYFV